MVLGKREAEDLRTASAPHRAMQNTPCSIYVFAAYFTKHERIVRHSCTQNLQEFREISSGLPQGCSYGAQLPGRGRD
jgi:hypothetical protein